MASPIVFILILNYNGWRDTVECLESVQRLTYPNYRIVVIDNGSTDDSMEKIKAWAAGELPVASKFFTYDPSTKPVRWIEYDRVTAEAGGLPELEEAIDELPPSRRMVIIQTGANLGYAGGNNVGIRYALKSGAANIWILNNDTVVHSKALSQLVETLKKYPDAGFAGSKLLYYDRPDKIQAAGGGRVYFSFGVARHYGWNEADCERWNSPFEPHYITGASLFVRREVCETVGLMDESYFLYAEEADWQLRARFHGWSTIYCPRSIVWHKESANPVTRDPLIEYLNTRNTLILCKKFKRHLLPIALLFNLMRAFKRYANGRVNYGNAIIRGICECIFFPREGQ